MFEGYRDEELVGEGGLGRLYRAVRVSTGGVVAIKELPDIASASPAWHRARRELEALLRLKGHPYVVSVEEIIDGPSGPCIVMEYAAGGSLMERLSVRPMSAAELVMTGQHVTQALVAAHEVGIVHRDVKPHNLLVGAFGQVKVCDFGISALVRGAEGRTQTQSLTLAYASPEELDGEAVIGPPADVYSFAATMLHLITGHRPTFRERMSGATGDISVPGGIEPALRPIMHAIRLSLAHDPADRPTMDDLRMLFDEAAIALGPARIHRLAATSKQNDLPTASVTEGPQPAQPITTDDMPPGAPCVDSDHDPTLVRPRQDDASSTVVRATVGVDTGKVDDRTSTVGATADPAPPSARRRNLRRRLLLAGVATLAVLAGGVLVFALNRGDNKTATPWTRQFGTTGNSRGSGVSVGSDGSVYVTGNTASDPGGTNPGGDDGFVRKYAADGTAVWTQQFGTTGKNSGSGVSVGSDGSVYVTGFTAGDPGGTNADGDDGFVRKYAADATVLWTQQFGTTGNSFGSGVSVGSDGSVYVTGFIKSDPGAGYVSPSAAFVRKYAADGTVMWIQQFDGGGLGVSVGSGGSVYVTGYTNVDPGGGNPFGSIGFVRKYAADATLVWTQQFGTTGNSFGYGVSVGSDGSVYVTGYTNGDPGGTNAGGDEGFVRKFLPDAPPPTPATATPLSTATSPESP